MKLVVSSIEVGDRKFIWTYRRQMAGDVPLWVEKSLLQADFWLRWLMRLFSWTGIYTSTICCLAAILTRALPPMVIVWPIAIIVCGVAMIFGALSGADPYQYDRHEEKRK
jgi:hypothetical protein